MTLPNFVQRAEAYCKSTNGSVTSWIRTDKHNAAVGGKPLSLHRLGLAIDVVYDAPITIMEASSAAASLGLEVIREGDHDHVQPQKDR